ncbi:AAA-ATPase At3g50940 [Lactuca sativa]|uniref:AAA+ ATPase domain-containing protein n=1 Tax=Lactuca sativa TaxID=4236 RepID=A0A9R1XL45_LACSA|nr:AAA-ATPase At3g50940 [Lactuca sativa]KAJ0218800.1 hypothetical protein LSAT_V11C300131030 [Lactuca sativa]
MAEPRLRGLSFPAMATPLSLLLAYAPQYAPSVMLLLTMYNLVPTQILKYVVNAVRFYWKPKSSKLTLLFDQRDGVSPNQMFDAAEAFLCTRMKPDSNCLRITKTVKEDHINVKFAKWEAIQDSFEGISLAWRYVIVPPQEKSNGGETPEKKYIELKFDKEYKDKIINSYLPWILEKAKEIENQKNVVKLHNLQFERSGYNRTEKESVKLDHPSTFDTLAMDPTMKKTIMEDLDLFLRRKDFYRKVGKAWKRGYLLYGPPGTGKSSLIAAMANYLKFDIYDLQLNSVGSDSSLKKLMLSTSNRSIIVIEDIDCSIQVHDRKGTIPSKYIHDKPKHSPQFSLCGLLNFIDGLWSCCGDERIIIFTTNHKERLDPALLRPGRMDVHIHMSYLTIDGFKTLAANYLNIHDTHLRFTEIEELINGTNVTPAEVAEELMKSDDQEIVLEGVVNFLKRKKTEEDTAKEQSDGGNDEVPEAKKAKVIS